jgi:hypothetical protein
MRITTISFLLALMLGSGCVNGSDGNTRVEGTGDEEFLKLRAGPGLGYRVILGLPEGTPLTRRACVTEAGQLWCNVSLASAPGLRGYVSADYLAGQ